MASNGISLDSAGIISTALEGVLYGFSVLMFGGTVFALLHKRSRKDVHRGMLVVACLFLIISTAHLIIDIIRLEDGLVKYRNSFPGGPPGFFADIAQSTFVIKNVLFAAQTCLGDGVMIYRCYVVWQSLWIVVVPIMCWCAVLATGIGSPYAVSQATAQSSNIFFKQTGEWITAFYSSTFATNVLSTGLLAYRIWTVNKRSSGARVTQGSLLPVMMVVLDSGLLYSVTLIAALMCFVSQSNGQYVVLDLIPPIISIAFYMIIIRVGIHLKRNTTNSMSVGSLVTARTPPNRSYQSQQYGMGSLQVHITHFTERNGEMESEGAPSFSKPDGDLPEDV